MLKIRPMTEEDFRVVVKWNMGKEETFLYQWAGKSYVYPLTLKQFRDKVDIAINTKKSDAFIYAIDLAGEDRLVGTLELSGVDYKKKTGSIGKFLIGDSRDRGKGYGKEALTLVLNEAFEHIGLKTIFLQVFDFNIGGIKCYEKVGFKKIKYEENVYYDGVKPWGRYYMAIEK